jgi:glutamate dehydrogenase (NAD(P)+)
MRLLDQPVGALTLSQRRAGHALAQAAAGAARVLRLPSPLTCALQGFGNLGRAAAYSLLQEGVRVVAIADEFGCVRDPQGLDVTRMLAAPQSSPVAATSIGTEPGRLFEVHADMLILAASEDAMSPEQAAQVQVPVVVVGANCGLTPAVERQLHDRGVLVVPDVVGGIGGSASMEALFGPRVRPSADEVLDGVSEMMRQIIEALVARGRRDDLYPGAAALSLATTASVHPDGRPYGCSPYLSRSAATVIGGVR